ncbi:MAG: ABC transporter ATP-binding protein/permease [Pseudomonadota bacterium]|nr:ABC transporter ATP-binding protein/permease [Pseudomonadota bacterium]
MTPTPQSTGRPGIRHLLTPYWGSRQRWRAWKLVALWFGITFGSAWLYVRANELTGELTDALLGRKWDALRNVIWLTIGVGVSVGALGVIRTAIIDLIDLDWRTWLTNHFLERWFSAHAYYEIERDGALTHADQRIAEDVRLFANSSIVNLSNVINVLVSMVAFTTVLWSLSGTLTIPIGDLRLRIPGYMVYVAVAYNLAYFMLVHWVGKRLVGLGMKKQTVEADYRHGAMQVRENAEQIALYGGAANELQRLRRRFAKVRQNVLAVVVRTAKLEMTRTVYGHVFAVLPTLTALPRYFAGEITLGGVTQAVGAFGQLSSSLGYFQSAYPSFAMWVALANRLRDLSWAIDKAHARPNGFTVARASQAGIHSSVLALRTPLGDPLADVAPLQLAAGSRTLVRGPSGTGKSTLLRTLAGLWLHGAGSVTLPLEARIMFLPQRSYLPTGTFKAAMCYPLMPHQFDDAACQRVLEACGLGTRITSLHTSDNWQQLLSGGEQQRVAFARVLLQRPDFVFLDEATSALDPATEALLYQALIAELPGSAIISVAHRTAVADYHDDIIDLVPSAAQSPQSC